jgi:hypothetical protein
MLFEIMKVVALSSQETVGNYQPRQRPYYKCRQFTAHSKITTTREQNEVDQPRGHCRDKIGPDSTAVIRKMRRI